MTANVSLSPPLGKLKPHFNFGAGIASGDHDHGSTNISTFNPLFPSGQFFIRLSPGAPNLKGLQSGISLDFARSFLISFDEWFSLA